LVASESKLAAVLVDVSPAAKPATGNKTENSNITASHGSPRRIRKLQCDFGCTRGIQLSFARYDNKKTCFKRRCVARGNWRLKCAWLRAGHRFGLAFPPSHLRICLLPADARNIQAPQKKQPPEETPAAEIE
jgi:hypothetical protein